MKKWKRWIVAILLSVMCLSLCGCQDLEEMRAEHATWQEDGSILWNGNVYRKLENLPASDVFGFEYAYITIRVTEPDVPVLLSDWFGESLDVCADGAVLEYYDYRRAEGKRQFYCREDVYHKVAAYLESDFEMGTYYYQGYWNDVTGRMENYYLTEEQKNTLNYILATVTPVLKWEFDEDWVDFFPLMGCDESHYVTQTKQQMAIIVTESRYCIEKDDYIYIVPMAFNVDMAEILKMLYAYDDDMVDMPPSMVVQ